MAGNDWGGGGAGVRNLVRMRELKDVPASDTMGGSEKTIYVFFDSRCEKVKSSVENEPRRCKGRKFTSFNLEGKLKRPTQRKSDLSFIPRGAATF